MTTYASTQEYNAAHPDAAYPDRQAYFDDYTHLADVEDARGAEVTLDFFPGGVTSDLEAVGNVVVRAYSGGGPVTLLAEGVRLGDALAAVLDGKTYTVTKFMTLLASQQASNAGS